jgi:hypoxanthine phosphoribosyltransferase
MGSVAAIDASAARPRAPRFAHPAERACAALFDYHGLAWEYEPQTFVLRRDEGGRPLEAFTPDFYLPDLDLYLEVTTVRADQNSRKRRKLRLLAETHPGVEVRLFVRRDVEALAGRLGLALDPELDAA